MDVASLLPVLAVVVAGALVAVKLGQPKPALVPVPVRKRGRHS